MFAAKIHSAQSQIQSLKAQIEALQQEVAQFRAFEEEVTSITEAIALT